jgi:sulfide:quinone oxidoreductase
MDIKQVSPEVSVSGQIKLADIPAIVAAGFSAIICNRPDGEAPDQPPSDAIGRAATKAGLDFRYIPVVPGQLTEAEVKAFAAALDELPSEILAYCRSGARSANLWSLAEERRRAR